MSDDPRGVRADEIAVGNTGPRLVIEDLEWKDFLNLASTTGDFNDVHWEKLIVNKVSYDSILALLMLSGD
jgi:hypothetical protein